MNLTESRPPNVIPLLLATMFVIAAGCGETAQSTDSVKTIVVRQPDSIAGANASSPDTSRAFAVREAQSLYTYGKERRAIRIKDPSFPGTVVADGKVPNVWIATATLKPGNPAPLHPILARIRSEGSYAPMGLVAGYNYIWRSSADIKTALSWQTKIISADRSAKSHILTRDARKYEYSHGMSAREPRLVLIKVHSVGLGVCLDDPVCPTRHCGYY
jgi:hypothetical protein